jgi:hypothetical protein
MTEMVDRMSRASWNACGLLDWDSKEAAPYRDEWRLRMRAAIEAMLEPTEAMVDAGAGEVALYDQSVGNSSSQITETAYRAMLRAALAA